MRQLKRDLELKLEKDRLKAARFKRLAESGQLQVNLLKSKKTELTQEVESNRLLRN